MKGVKTYLNFTLTFLLLILACSFLCKSVRAQSISFSDVSPDDPNYGYAYSFIMAMAERGITTGYGDGTFRPGEPVKRDAVAAFFVRAITGTNDPICNGNILCQNTQPYFKDVPSDYLFFKHIQKLYELGITKGWEEPDGRYYKPYENISRAAVAAFMIRALEGDDPICQGGIPCSQTQPYFQDVPPNHPQFKYIQRLKELGITKGCNAEGTLYCPARDVKRYEMAIFIGRAFLGLREEVKTYTQGFTAAIFLYEKLNTFNEMTDLISGFTGVSVPQISKASVMVKKSKGYFSELGSQKNSINYLLEKMKKYFSSLTPLKVSKAESGSENCPYGGTLTYNIDFSGNNFNATLSFNNCAMDDGFVMNGKFRVYGTMDSFTALFGEGQTPFVVNINTQEEQIKAEFLLKINYLSVTYGDNFLSFNALANGTIEIQDFTDNEFYRANYNNFGINFSYQKGSVTEEFAFIINGMFEEQNNLNFGNLYKYIGDFQDFRIDYRTDLYSFDEFSLNGIFGFRTEPKNVCVDGRYSYRTVTPIRFDYNSARFTQGKIEITELNSGVVGTLIIKPDGTLTVSVNGITENYSDFEGEIPGICSL